MVGGCLNQAFLVEFVFIIIIIVSFFFYKLFGRGARIIIILKFEYNRFEPFSHFDIFFMDNMVVGLGILGRFPKIRSLSTKKLHQYNHQ